MRSVIPVSVLGFFLLFGLAAQCHAQGFDLGLALGAQFSGDISDFNLDTDDGFSLGLEMIFDLPVLKLGVGYEYGFPRDTNGLLSDLEYHLVYGIGRFSFIGPVYAVGRLGFADLRARFDRIGHWEQGSSWSIGVGAHFSKIRAELLYNNFNVGTGGGHSADLNNYAARLIYIF